MVEDAMKTHWGGAGGVLRSRTPDGIRRTIIAQRVGSAYGLRRLDPSVIAEILPFRWVRSNPRAVTRTMSRARVRHDAPSQPAGTHRENVRVPTGTVFGWTSSPRFRVGLPSLHRQTPSLRRPVP